MKNIKTRLLVSAGVLTASASAFATGSGPDASAVTGVITGFVAFIGAVGGAMVLITVAKKAWGKIGG